MASSKTNLAAGDLFLSESPHGGVAASENKERDQPGFHRHWFHSIPGWKVERVPS